jgi:hypothetical protein
MVKCCFLCGRGSILNYHFDELRLQHWHDLILGIGMKVSTNRGKVIHMLERSLAPPPPGGRETRDPQKTRRLCITGNIVTSLGMLYLRKNEVKCASGIKQLGKWERSLNYHSVTRLSVFQYRPAIDCLILQPKSNTCLNTEAASKRTAGSRRKEKDTRRQAMQG